MITIGLLRTAVGPLLALYFTPARAWCGRCGSGPSGPSGALPARRAGPRRGAGPARRRDARRGHPPGQPDGAAGRRAADHRHRRRHPPRRRGAARRGLSRPWTSCATWSASCAPRREGDQPPPAAGLAALVAESTAVGTPAELDRGRRPGAGLPCSRPHRVPDRPGGAHQRPQARPRRAGLVRSATATPDGQRPQHAAGAGRPGRPGRALAPAWASPACASASSSCTARSGPAPNRTAGSAWRPRCRRTSRPPRPLQDHGRRGHGRRATDDPGGGRRRRADGLRPPAHDPRLGPRHRGRGRGPRRRGRCRRRVRTGPTSC